MMMDINFALFKLTVLKYTDPPPFYNNIIYKAVFTLSLFVSK